LMKIWENSSSSSLLMLFKKDSFWLWVKCCDLLSSREGFSFLLIFLLLSYLIADDFCLWESRRVDFCLVMWSNKDFDCGLALVFLQFIFRSYELFSLFALLLTLLVLFREDMGLLVFWERISAFVLEVLSSGTLDKLSFWNRFCLCYSRSMFGYCPSFSLECSLNL
jgi:hypothetical protein